MQTHPTHGKTRFLSSLAAMAKRVRQLCPITQFSFDHPLHQLWMDQQTLQLIRWWNFHLEMRRDSYSIQLLQTQVKVLTIQGWRSVSVQCQRLTLCFWIGIVPRAKSRNQSVILSLNVTLEIQYNPIQLQWYHYCSMLKSWTSNPKTWSSMSPFPVQVN